VIYRLRFHRFVRVAQAITRSREPAVDAVHDAFAGLIVNRASFRGEGVARVVGLARGRQRCAAVAARR